MKAGHLQFLAGLNREAFNTLRRRGHLGFLDKHVGEGVGRFNSAHALGVTALRWLMDVGLETSAAAQAVNDSWPDIYRIAGLGEEPVNSFLCGTRMHENGVVDSWGWPHPNSVGAQVPIASAAIDLRRLWDRLQPALADLESAAQ